MCYILYIICVIMSMFFGEEFFGGEFDSFAEGVADVGSAGELLGGKIMTDGNR